VHDTHYVFGDLNTWGWVVLCIGVLQWAVGCGVLASSDPNARAESLLERRERDPQAARAMSDVRHPLFVVAPVVRELDASDGQLISVTRASTLSAHRHQTVDRPWRCRIGMGCTA
jgi:hypothetical protein